jgi:hypothetical protein
MRANRSQTLDAAQVAAHATPRRRSVPTRRRTPVQQSLHQRWRERPHYAALPLTPGCRNGVVHAIVTRVPCRCPRVPFVQEHRAARLPLCVPTCVSPRGRRRGPAMRLAICSCAVPVLLQNLSHSLVMIVPPTIAPTMLAPCSASSMLFAWLRPGPRPGLRALTTPVRGTVGQLRDGGPCDASGTGLDERFVQAYVDRITPVPHGTPPVRHTGLRSAHSADARRARYRAHPSGHRSPYVPASRGATSQDVRGHEAAFTQRQAHALV